MMRMVSFRSVCATTSTCPAEDAPSVRKRASSRECVASGNVVESGSSSAVAASWKATRCFLAFAAAFVGSHSNCIVEVYAPLRNRRQTADGDCIWSGGRREETFLHPPEGDKPTWSRPC